MRPAGSPMCDVPFQFPLRIIIGALSVDVWFAGSLECHRDASPIILMPLYYIGYFLVRLDC